MIKTISEYKIGVAELIYYLEQEPEYGTDEGIAYDMLKNAIRAYEVENIDEIDHVLDVNNNAVRLRKAFRAMSSLD